MAAFTTTKSREAVSFLTLALLLSVASAQLNLPLLGGSTTTSNDLTGGLLNTVNGVVNTVTGTAGGTGGLTSGLPVVGGTTGSGDLVGGVVDTVSGVVNGVTGGTGGLTSGLPVVGGTTGSGDLVGGVVDAVNGVVGGVTGGSTGVTGGLLSGNGSLVGNLLNGTLTTVDNLLNTTGLNDVLNITLGTVGDTLSGVLAPVLQVVGSLLGDVLGTLYCDVCQDGTFDAGVDYALTGVQLLAECKVCLTAGCADPLVLKINSTTDSTGSFELLNLPTVNAVQLGNPDQQLLGCAVHIGSNPNANCSVVKAGLCGFGNDLDIQLPGVLQTTGTLGNIGLGNVCLTGASVPDTCDSGVTGDPHFTGGHGAHFDFTGVPQKSYCILSDSHLHMNMYVDGRFAQWGDNPQKPLTWIRKLAILWGHHTILMEVRTGAEWKYGSGFLARLAVDGEYVSLPAPGSSVSVFDSQGSIEWVEARKGDSNPLDIYEVVIKDILKMRVRIQPEIPYMRTDEDAAVHINLEMEKVRLTEHAHGVMGQTFRAEYSGRLSNQVLVHNDQLDWDMVPGDNAEGFLDGTVTDYENEGLFSATCKYSRFTRAEAIDTETSEALEISGGQVEGRQMLLSHTRKMLSVQDGVFV